MKLVEDGKTHPHGEAMLQELLFIHELVRDNLQVVRSISADVANGAALEAIADRMQALKSSSIVWRLRAGCIQYCHFVHGHHQHEDHLWFPTLRQLNPALHPVIDRLQRDHQMVAHLLDDVETIAGQILENENARTDLVQALNQLSAHLLAHLEYEETQLAPTLRRIQSWTMGENAADERD
jgi:hemerythrin-like domain-containing protein